MIDNKTSVEDITALITEQRESHITKLLEILELIDNIDAKLQNVIELINNGN